MIQSINTRELFISGISFGLGSGVITTLGLLVGLYFGTQSRLAVIAGILTIAIADACSDAFGMHMAEESKGRYTHPQIWVVTFVTFFTKAIVAITFLVPFILFELETGVWVSVIWGFALITLLNYRMAKASKEPVLRLVTTHLGMAVLVVITTYFVGKAIAYYFS